MNDDKQQTETALNERIEKLVFFPKGEETNEIAFDILRVADKLNQISQNRIHNKIKASMEWSGKNLKFILKEQRIKWFNEKDEDTSKYPQQLNFYNFPHYEPMVKGIRLTDTMENLEHLLKQYSVTVQWDQIKKIDVIKLPGGESKGLPYAYETIISLVKLNKLPQINVMNRIAAISYENPINRVTDHLKSLEYKGTGFIQQLAEHITVENGTEHIRDQVFRMWMIMACAAADYAQSTPNKKAIAKFDSVMIFVGKQGLGKTRFFREMLPKLLRQYMNDGVVIDPTDRDSICECLQWWIIEAGEIDGLFRKTDISRFKAFLSKHLDFFRKAYGRAAQEYQRTTAFVGSANERDFLKDYTGNRRYWPLFVRKLMPPTDENLINNAWAEAWTAYITGEAWWPQTDMEENLLSQVASFQIPVSGEPVEEAIRDLIRKGNGAFACDVVRPSDIKDGLGSNLLGENTIDKIPSIIMIGKIMTQCQLGVHIKSESGAHWIIRNKEKYEKMKNSRIEKYYNDFHDTK